MHGERYIEIMVECPDCETRQKVHVSTATVARPNALTRYYDAALPLGTASLLLDSFLPVAHGCEDGLRNKKECRCQQNSLAVDLN
jgi:hypothetical protein